MTIFVSETQRGVVQSAWRSKKQQETKTLRIDEEVKWKLKHERNHRKQIARYSQII